MDLNTYINSECSLDKMPVIYFDLDGTLVNNNKIEPDCIEFIQLIKNLGIPVGIATGRSYIEATHHIQAIKPTIPSVLCDGQLIYDYITDTYTSLLEYPFLEYQELKNVMKSDLLFVDEYYNHYKADSRKATRLFCLSMKANEHEFKQDIYGAFQIAGFASSLRGSSSITVMNEIKRKLDLISLDLNRLDYYCYGTYWVKFIAKKGKDVSKASAVLNILKGCSLDLRELWYFGDGGNDIELMNLASIKLIMQNADSELKKVQNGLVLNSSISDAIREIYLLLAKRYL